MELTLSTEVASQKGRLTFPDKLQGDTSHEAAGTGPFVSNHARNNMSSTRNPDRYYE